MKSLKVVPLLCALFSVAAPGSAQMDARSVEASPDEAPIPMPYGSFEVGRLSIGDGQLRGGEFRDLFTFVGKAGDPVIIDLVSEDFDPYLALISPSGKVLRNDDWGSSPASRIRARLIEDGEYRIVVTSFRAGEEGTYVLRIQDQRVRIAD